jgi:hypothetical protein
MTDATFDELDALPTEQLRERAFAQARHRHDLGFFLDLFRHLPGADTYDEGGDGSLGLQAGVDEAVALWRELRGHGYGDEEPLIRARFIDYLLKPED